MSPKRLSLLLGMGWGLVPIFWLFGTSHNGPFVFFGVLGSSLLAGAGAGYCAGRFTARSYARSGGGDRFWVVVGTYFIGILSYSLLISLPIAAVFVFGPEQATLAELLVLPMTLLVLLGFYGTLLFPALGFVCWWSRQRVRNALGPEFEWR